MTSGGRCLSHARPNSGFTLLEILVVLTLMSLAYALAPPMFASGVSTTELKGASRQIAAGLRKARSQAIFTRQETTLNVDVDAHTFTLTGDSKVHRLPEKSKVSVFSAQSDAVVGKSGAIRFYPDGSSTGGRITVTAGERKYLVDVSWLTGQVEIREMP